MSADADRREGAARIDRRQFFAGLGATSFGLLLAACGAKDEGTALPPAPATTERGVSPAATTEGPLKKGLAAGMYGGPVGFPGAERYQYPLDSEEGRAIAGLRRLRRDGKAPEKLLVQVTGSYQPQLATGFPEGAPSLVQLLEEETGITIEFVDPDAGLQDNLRNASTRNGSFDLVGHYIAERGDLAEAGLLRPLDDFVEKYRPSWLDPVYGFAGGKPTVSLFTKYKGSFYSVPLDNDTQPYFYRGDLLDDVGEQAEFADRYGRELRFPLTWDEQAEVAEFFTRPDADPPLYGDVTAVGPYWCIVNWYERFVCSNERYFNDDGSANVDNEAGVRAFAELARSLEWHPPDALEYDFTGQWQLMGAGSGWGGGSYAGLVRFLPGNPEIDTANVGRHFRTDVMPGRVVDGGLVRRPVVDGNPTLGVNAFSPRERHEAAYLFLQWVGGARVHTWLAFNPAGHTDPQHIYSLDDPYLAAAYKPQRLGAFRNIAPRTAPPVTLKGGYPYADAVSEHAQKVLRKEQTPEQAAKALQDRWDRITEEQGVETQVAALETFFEAFPQITDPPDRELPVEEVSTAVS